MWPDCSSPKDCRAADVEVVGGELEAGAERVERLQYLETALGLRGDLALRQRQRIGAHLRPTHAAAELVELREPNMSARCTISVLAAGMSSPDSMIVSRAGMSYLPS